MLTTAVIPASPGKSPANILTLTDYLTKSPKRQGSSFVGPSLRIRAIRSGSAIKSKEDSASVLRGRENIPSSDEPRGGAIQVDLTSKTAHDWDYSTLPANVRLGRDCFIERKNSFDRYRSEQDPGLLVGSRVNVSCFAALTLGRSGRVGIGDDSILGGGVFLCARRITIGKRVIISYG